MLNTLGHNALLCYAQYSHNVQHCAIVHLCINFSLFEQLCTICGEFVVPKVKNCAQCTIPQQTCTMQMNHMLCLAVCMFVHEYCA